MNSEQQLGLTTLMFALAYLFQAGAITAEESIFVQSYIFPYLYWGLFGVAGISMIVFMYNTSFKKKMFKKPSDFSFKINKNINKRGFIKWTGFSPLFLISVYGLFVLFEKPEEFWPFVISGVFVVLALGLIFRIIVWKNSP